MAPEPTTEQTTEPVAAITTSSSRLRRALKERAFQLLLLAGTSVGLIALLILIVDVSIDGGGSLSLKFLTSFPSRIPANAGIYSALIGTLWIIALTALIAIPLGVGAAIYLEEFAPNNRMTRLMEANISNLAGVPSIVYGILGLALFVRFFALERSIIAGSLTMALLVLPIIIVAGREAIRAVPSEVRLAGLALGATKWEVTRHQVLPAATPGILTGIILAISRGIGETAPLIMIGALAFIAFLPEGPSSSFTVLPIQIFNWISRPQEEFHALAAAGILVLLVVLILINAVAVFIRHRYQRKW